ncbi:hypothetical protein HMPREF9466_01508 [Fusobacterium necrophorum subsp. funduliforme 1_1_36S]|nr:hypothetical protein HMPREF9466_01508 [Fusobacterium necrophorum subsp. funduliforme 1_1_36S]
MAEEQIQEQIDIEALKKKAENVPSKQFLCNPKA